MQMNEMKIRLSALLAAGVAITFAVGCAVSTAAAQNAALNSDRAMSAPNDDAVILHWKQHWTLDHDGTVHQRNHYRVKILNTRPIGRFGDPRIGYLNDRDKLIFHKAQATLPDGSVLPVPDYSFNIVGPDDVGGWPEYADWREMVVSFGGIEPGVILELDYEIVTPPNDLPWIDADIRLDDDYPVVERVVSITVPSNVTVNHRLDRAPGVTVDENHAATGSGATSTCTWTAKALQGDRGQPRSLPWRRRSPRLRFTTCPDSTTWASRIIDSVDRSAAINNSIKSFTDTAVENERDPVERVRKLATKLSNSFNFVSSSRAMRGLACRQAGDVLNANYGNTLESATLLLAALRSLGYDARPAVGVDAAAWNESDQIAPTGSALAAALVQVDLPQGAVYVHPRLGMIKNPGVWGRHRVLTLDANRRLHQTYLYARGERDPSDLRITGKIAIDKTARATGELRIHLTGAFYDPAGLETAEKQKSLIEKMVARVLTDFDVDSHSVVTLSDDSFKATANVVSKANLKKYDRHHVLKFGDGPAFLNSFHLPLDRTLRHSDVYLGGRVHEDIDVTVEFPDTWWTSVSPASLPPAEGTWGRASQSVSLDGQSLRFHRAIVIATETISADGFGALSRAVNALRSTRHLVLACGE